MEIQFNTTALSLGLAKLLDNIEKECVLSALSGRGWNKSAVARDLKISRPQVHYLIRKHGLKKPVGFPLKEIKKSFEVSDDLAENG